MCDQTEPTERHKHDQVADSIGPAFGECCTTLLECVTGGDLFDCAAGDLAASRGYDPEVTWNAEANAQYDKAFFHLLDAVVYHLRTTWGGYYNTFKEEAATSKHTTVVLNAEGRTVGKHVHHGREESAL